MMSYHHLTPPSSQPIDIDALARRVEVDNRFPLAYYYRIADTLLKRADVYRQERNILDLYVMLTRFSSLVSETIPFHRDYQSSDPREKKHYKKKILAVLDELEDLKPEFHRRVSELNKASRGKQLQPANSTFQPSREQNNDFQALSSTSMPYEKKFSKLSLSVPLPKQETLSRHSFLGPSGLRGQWQGPISDVKVCYPRHADLPPLEDLRLIQDTPSAVHADKGGSFGQDMEAILSLDDGRWSVHEEDRIIRQPIPPPVLAQVQPELHPISPSRVADPRPGPARPLDDGMRNPSSYQHLHIPVKMMDDFLRLAQKNTSNNLETCGVLAGSLKNSVFHITSLIIPKQESTSDSCQTLNEEEIFEIQDRLSLFPLGWIHTHPTQTCFMSSVDLHTHYSYQIMLPEAIAIVMAPTDSSSPHGIFHLSDPGGVSVIRHCDQRGFHPHEEPSDGTPLYEHCSHVYMNPKLKFDVADLR